MATTQLRKQPRPIERDTTEDDDAFYTTRSHSSVRRYRTAPPDPDTQHDLEPDGIVIQRRRSLPITEEKQQVQRTSGMLSNAVTTTKTEALRPLRKFQFPRRSWNFLLVGMGLMIVLLFAGMAVSSWWATYQNDLHYGRPRTYQFDAVVGHEDSASHPTHFILINLHSHIEVIEIPGGDVAHTRIYTGPILYGNGQDLTPVTGTVRDVNGDGKPDLVLTIQNQHFVFLNTGTIFQAQSQ